MTPDEALDRIAALCDRPGASVVSKESLRAVLAEVTPGTDCEDAVTAAYQRGVAAGRETTS